MTGSGWVELGDRCWLRRYPEWDVNVGVVAGTDGLIVVDTRGTLAQGEALRADVVHLHAGPIRHVVNTHWHFDHAYGNAAFEPDVGDNFFAHENAARDLAETPALTPRVTFDRSRTIDLGDRSVELRYLGRGHTDGDIVVQADGVMFAGDLIEQSGDPSFGEDSFPIEWPDTVTQLASLLREHAVVAPGHGDPVDRAFVLRQLGDLLLVADTIQQLYGKRVPLDDALRHPHWPFPGDHVAEAIRRGYAQLAAGRGQG